MCNDENGMVFLIMRIERCLTCIMMRMVRSMQVLYKGYVVIQFITPIEVTINRVTLILITYFKAQHTQIG